MIIGRDRRSRPRSPSLALLLGEVEEERRRASRCDWHPNPKEQAMKVPESHIHSLERCEHEIIGEEVHWMCGMHPVWTNASTAWAVHDDDEQAIIDRAIWGGVMPTEEDRATLDMLVECKHLSATVVGEQVARRVTYRCDTCEAMFRVVTDDDGAKHMVNLVDSNDMSEGELAQRWTP